MHQHIRSASLEHNHYIRTFGVQPSLPNFTVLRRPRPTDTEHFIVWQEARNSLNFSQISMRVVLHASSCLRKSRVILRSQITKQASLLLNSRCQTKDLPNPEIPFCATCKMFSLIWNMFRFLRRSIVRHGIEVEDAGHSTSREVSQMLHVVADGH